nr:hypothetical protein Iba_chr01eCG1920 [Ipomoea batatas]GME06872.1 hypothetical protein Iba_scaffold5434CG0010 [Ipomoea batatas]
MRGSDGEEDEGDESGKMSETQEMAWHESDTLAVGEPRGSDTLSATLIPLLVQDED